MRSEERQQKIAQYLHAKEFASLEELAKHVQTSVSTVRRDLTTLEESGTIRRTHGGARNTSPRTDEFTFAARDQHEVAEKDAIGKACAELIQSNQSVIIDVGTTPYHVAQHLENKKPQIITNSLPVANLFGSAHMVEVVVAGGVIYPRLGFLMGPLAVETFSKIHADVAVMSGGGLTSEGITNSHVLLIEIQRAMMKAAQRVIFCLDHTKLGRKSVAHLCTLDEVDTVITDSLASQELVNLLQARDIEVILAPVESSGKTS